MLHRNLLLPCPYLVEEEVKKNQKAKYDLTETDGADEEEYHVWAAAKEAKLPLNAEAQQCCPQRETPGERAEELLIPEVNTEEEPDSPGVYTRMTS